MPSSVVSLNQIALLFNRRPLCSAPSWASASLFFTRTCKRSNISSYYMQMAIATGSLQRQLSWAGRRVNLSPRIRFGLRLALAMVMAYWVALSMDWQRPFWAGISVTVLSLDSAGQSMLKVVLRFVGTVVGAVVALSLIALFPQDRWLFFLSLSLYEGFCCYRMLGSSYPYAWTVSGFVAAVIAIDGGPPDGLTDFNVAIERLLETGTGILAYTFSGFLIPTGSMGGAFQAKLAAIAQRLGHLLPACLAPYGGRHSADPQTAKDLRQLHADAATFETLVAPAAMESGSIWMERRRWGQVALAFRLLPRALSHVRLAGFELGNRERLLLDQPVSALQQRLGQRFAAMGNAVDGESTLSSPIPPPLSGPTPLERMDCSIEEQAHLLASWRSLLELDAISHRLVGIMRGLSAPLLGAPSSGPALGWPPQQEARLASIDPDHLWLAIRLVIQIWIAVLLWIYLPGLPNGLAIISLIPSVGLPLAQMPLFRGQTLFAPGLQALLAAGILYVFVLPKLDGFLGLASVLGIATFVIGACYYKNGPKRNIMMILIIVSCNIQNQQSYDFIGFLNLALAIILTFSILTLSQDLPMSWLPERQALRLLHRLMSSATAIVQLTTQEAHDPLPWPQRICLAFHRRVARGIPSKLAALSSSLPLQMLKLNKIQIDDLLGSVESLSLWLDEWSEPLTLLTIPPFRLPLTSFSDQPGSSDDHSPWSRPPHRLDSMVVAVGAVNAGCCSRLTAASPSPATGPGMDGLAEWLGCGLALESALRQLQAVTASFEWKRWQQPRFS